MFAELSSGSTNNLNCVLEAKVRLIKNGLKISVAACYDIGGLKALIPEPFRIRFQTDRVPFKPGQIIGFNLSFPNTVCFFFFRTEMGQWAPAVWMQSLFASDCEYNPHAVPCGNEL